MVYDVRQLLICARHPRLLPINLPLGHVLTFLLRFFMESLSYRENITREEFVRDPLYLRLFCLAAKMVSY